MSIQTDVQALEGEALVELFVVDATVIGGGITRFHAGSNNLRSNVVWQGETFIAMPVEVTGFEISGRGKMPRPTMKMQNVDGLIGALADTFDDLIGTKVTRKRTFAKYLDAVNFAGGVNPTADPDAYFVDDVFFINRKLAHTKAALEFELASSLDVQGVQIPRRQIIQHTCIWRYRSSECSYAGPAVADIDDNLTADLAVDACGKRIVSCQLRFGATAVLPYGGFPGASVVNG